MERGSNIFAHALESVASALETVLFYPFPFPGSEEGFPLLVLWLLVGGIFFTFRLGFNNFRMIYHGLQVVRGKYKHEEGEGDISSFQAVATVVSGTVGVGGNIAGVAIAVSVGGPGAVIWIMLAGFLCTANKFAEVIVGQKYRQKDENGQWNGGAWHYLKDGLKETAFPFLGKPLGILFAICCIGGALGGGNMFQSNQVVEILVTNYPSIAHTSWMISVAMAVIVAIVLIGGIKRIASITEKLVPTMAFIYVSAGMVILILNASQIPEALSIMFHHAFTMEAAGGGMMGAMIMGLRRAFFSCEAGLGTAPIVHAATRNKEPVREGCAALIEPIIDSVIICTMTGLVIVLTGAYQSVDGMSGVSLTSTAFASVIPWFPHVLALCVLLFAFSTIITWSYYGERAWNYLTKGRYVQIYYLVFCGLTFVGGITQLGPVVLISDLLILCMAVPNLIGLYLMSGMITREIKAYKAKMTSK